MALHASRFGNLLAGTGVLAGIVLIFAGGWSLLTPWLAISFALIAVLMAVERKFDFQPVGSAGPNSAFWYSHGTTSQCVC